MHIFFCYGPTPLLQFYLMPLSNRAVSSMSAKASVQNNLHPAAALHNASECDKVGRTREQSASHQTECNQEGLHPQALSF